MNDLHTTEEYRDFLASKARLHACNGIDVDPSELHSSLFDWQARIVSWALRKGQACLFEDCGLGKTFQQLAWAHHVPGDVLLVAPLAVAEQTKAEADRWGYSARVSRDGSKAAKITITNYEQIQKFDLADFGGLVLDESSILKSHTGSTRNAIIEASARVPFRLACTATPAPNDYMELGNHSEFVGALSRVEMLSTYFVHDGGDTAKWRLKGHAVEDFWSWLATWAVMLRTPADIGGDREGFDLPPLEVHERIIQSGIQSEGQLFALPARSLNEQRRARRATAADRGAAVAELVNTTPGPWVVWCELNAEGDALTKAIDGAIQVAGSDSPEVKSERLGMFASGDARVLVTKPKIAGFGMNWQHCHQMAFVGLSHSWEQYYQAIRRCWRFGQLSPVEVFVFSTDVELAVLENIKRKQDQADDMASKMVEMMSETMNNEINGESLVTDTPYDRDMTKGDDWTVYHADCVEVTAALPDDSLHYTVFSPPFASLYTYSASDRDMGNSADQAEFFVHFDYLIGELYRATMPGRLLSFHCMNLPTSKTKHGVIGLSDFRGELIRRFVDAGWIFHSEVVIWKDPVTAMQRTKALGLLHKQIKKDSCMSRQGIPDYLVTMRKPGENPERVSHTNESFPVSMWQRYASPVWHDIKPNDTLQYRSAREHEDERHICPLQLDVIRRALMLWSNPGDTVYSPFTGIGSEGYVALQEGRRFIGAELKASYYEQACRNLTNARAQQTLAL